MVYAYIYMNQPWVYMCSPSWTPSHFPPHPIPQNHPSAPALSALCRASNLNWWSSSHMIIYMFQCYSCKSSHPCLLPQSPKVCSSHLCLFCCLAYRVLVGWHSSKHLGIQPPLLNSKVTLAKFSFSWSFLNLTIWKINLCLMGLLWRLNYLAYRGLLL